MKARSHVKGQRLYRSPIVPLLILRKSKQQIENKPNKEDTYHTDGPVIPITTIRLFALFFVHWKEKFGVSIKETLDYWLLFLIQYFLFKLQLYFNFNQS